MDDYYEMEAEQRNNSRRLKQMGRKKAGKDMPFPNERRSTFSGRMIIVVLILSVTMFLKQMQLLDNSRVYHAGNVGDGKTTDCRGTSKSGCGRRCLSGDELDTGTIKLYKLAIISTLNLLNIDS